jgi:hypothetical protein
MTDLEPHSARTGTEVFLLSHVENNDHDLVHHEADVSLSPGERIMPLRVPAGLLLYFAQHSTTSRRDHQVV